MYIFMNQPEAQRPAPGATGVGCPGAGRRQEPETPAPEAAPEPCPRKTPFDQRF